jgi:DNA-binding XRE family transcriptional regulator
MNYIPLQDVIDRQMHDPEFRKAWEEADAEFSLLDSMIRARVAAGLTQAQVAERAGTTQSAIARLEGGRVSPSFATLKKYAAACGKKLRVEMV